MPASKPLLEQRVGRIEGIKINMNRVHVFKHPPAKQGTASKGKTTKRSWTGYRFPLARIKDMCVYTPPHTREKVECDVIKRDVEGKTTQRSRPREAELVTDCAHASE